MRKEEELLSQSEGAILVAGNSLKLGGGYGCHFAYDLFRFLDEVVTDQAKLQAIKEQIKNKEKN